jgi:hypothetical protein
LEEIVDGVDLFTARYEEAVVHIQTDGGKARPQLLSWTGWRRTSTTLLPMDIGGYLSWVQWHAFSKDCDGYFAGKVV